MKIRLTGAMAALAATLMLAPAAMAHGSFGPSGGQGQGNMMGQGYGGMGQGQGQGYGGMGHGHGGYGGMGHGHGGYGGMGHGQGYGGMGHGHGYGGMGQGRGGYGGMGQGHGYGGMGQGHGYGGMGQGYGGMGMAAPLAEDLSSDGVRHMMEHRVARTGNPNLKVGEIVEQDDDTITADVVTQDGSLVRRFMVDRHTGMMRQADMDNMEK